MCKRMFNKVKDYGKKFYQRYEDVIWTCASYAILVITFISTLYVGRNSAIRSYQKGFGLTKDQATWVYEKSRKLDAKRATVVGNRIGKCILAILKMEP